MVTCEITVLTKIIVVAVRTDEACTNDRIHEAFDALIITMARKPITQQRQLMTLEIKTTFEKLKET